MTTIETRLRPATFEELVGQERMKRRLDLALASALRKRTPFPSTYFCGPPGAGKSTVANLIAEHLGDPIMTIAKPCTSRELVNRLTRFGAGLVFFDEVHQWRNRQDELLPLVEAQCIDTGSQMIEFPWITVVAATTEPQNVKKPFLDRFKVRPVIEPYNDSEMTQIAALMASKAGLELDEGLLTAIGRAAGGVPRNARTMVLVAEEMRDSNEAPTIDEILYQTGFEADGLSIDHVRYLEALHANSGQAGLPAVRTRLRCSESVALDLESLLLERQMITYEKTGRMLLPEGRARIGKLPILRRAS